MARMPARELTVRMVAYHKIYDEGTVEERALIDKMVEQVMNRGYKTMGRDRAFEFVCAAAVALAKKVLPA